MTDPQRVNPDPTNGLCPPRRYTDRPFPPYRFIPGKHPHPTAHPDGHSYHAPGDPPHEVHLVTPENWADSENYLFACDLYNHGYWWEAHEEWEGLWQLTDKKGAQGRFLQGLIQVSACHLKFFVGHQDGVQRLLRTSLEHLRVAASMINNQVYMGLEVSRFAVDVMQYYQQRLNERADSYRHNPNEYPYLSLDN